MPQNHNTLTGLFSDIADAIRAKTGGSSQIVADDFPTAIANILSGPARTSADLSASGATVTAPAGVYSTDASASVASGSATTPATTISSSPTITVSSAGLITATNSKTQSVTPTVSAGYVSSGTAGTITVSGSNTKQLTTQAAQTKYPSTSDQTISSGRYLTGTQTFKGVLLTNLTAANIKKDVVVKVGDSSNASRIASITGTYEGSGGSGPALPDSSTVTDLTGTTWLMNDNMNVCASAIPSSYSNQLKTLILMHWYQTNYESQSQSYSFRTPFMPKYGLWRNTTGGLWDGETNTLTSDDYAWWYNNKRWSLDSPQNPIFVQTRVFDEDDEIVSTYEWYYGRNCRLWSFLGSTTLDVSANSNSTFVNWVKANGTLINTGR